MQRVVKVDLKGISPLLMHAFPMVPIEAFEKKSPAEQAELAAHRREDGQLFVPGVAIQRALIHAATYSKGKGRGSLAKNAAACLMVTPEHVLLGTKEYAIDSRPVVVPATRGRVVRHRPRLDDWEISFEIEFDDSLINEKELRQIVDDMGKRVGLLDFRPERRGPFGRSVVTHWVLG